MPCNVIANKKVGIYYEDLAILFLQKNGFKIIEHNYRYKHNEIDIIAKKNEYFHFIEVKFRQNNSFGYPETFVSESQQKRIKEAAENFLFENKIGNKIIFDIIAIEKTKKNEKITFFEDAF